MNKVKSNIWSGWFCALDPSPTSHKCKRLKQLMREHGVKWKVMHGPEPMQCFNGALGVHVESIDGTHRRNIHFDDIWKSEVGEWMFLHEELLLFGATYSSLCGDEFDMMHKKVE